MSQDRLADNRFENYQPRAAEKQASRDQDAFALASGTKSIEELRKENTFLPMSARGAIDYRNVPLIT